MVTLRQRVEEDRLRKSMADANAAEADRWRQEVIFRSAGHAKENGKKELTDKPPVNQVIPPWIEPPVPPQLVPTKAAEPRTADDIIAERALTHGDFAENARIAQTIRYAIREGSGWLRLNMEQRESLEYIAGKMARAASGDGLHVDNFTDIGGFARLGELATIKRLKS